MPDINRAMIAHNIERHGSQSYTDCSDRYRAPGHLWNVDYAYVDHPSRDEKAEVGKPLLRRDPYPAGTTPVFAAPRKAY